LILEKEYVSFLYLKILFIPLMLISFCLSLLLLIFFAYYYFDNPMLVTILQDLLMKISLLYYFYFLKLFGK